MDTLTIDLTTDPVCFMQVDPAKTGHHRAHGDGEYHFCSAACADKFAADPDKYLKKEDPVCGMSVYPLKSPHRHTHGGTRYHFCSAGCKDKFAADPGAYLGDRAPAPPADASALYYCPNLPKVDLIGPGNCPHCGSPLEPRNPIAALEED